MKFVRQWFIDKLNVIGCGMHKDSVLATIPLDQRCKCHLIKQSHQQPSSNLVDIIEDDMDTDIISLKHASDDRHPHVENEEDRRAAQSLPDLAKQQDNFSRPNYANCEDSTQSDMKSFFFLCCVVPECGLKFIQTAKNPIEYSYGPRSVAAGDFNNDTWIDMVVANHIVNTIAIYFGQNDGTFSTPIQYSTGVKSIPYMVVVDDFSNDELLDIAVANFGTNSISVFLGLGNGSFVKYTELSTGSSRPISISVSDLNNDTLLDIVTVNYGTHSISILYGYGKGNFSSATSYSTGYDSFPSSVASGDFNNDKYLDLAIANYGTDNILILFGNKNETFSNQITISTSFGSHPNSIAVGHFNRDAYIDIAVANYGNNTIGVLLNHGSGTFAQQAKYSTGSASPYAIAASDFNQDSRLDLFVTSKGYNNTALLSGYGNGTFTEPATFPTGAFTSISLAIEDFNGDNHLDIAIVSNDTGIIDILLSAFEGFENQLIFSTSSHQLSVAVGDFNNDDLLDIVVTNPDSNDVSVLFGYGDGSFTNETTYLTGSNPQFVAVGDFNNDAQLDIVVANYDSDDVSVLLACGNGSFANETRYSAGTSPISLVVDDFNNDSHLDIVVVNYGTNDANVFLGYGNGSFHDETKFSTGSNPQFVAVGDFNNDTRLDIVVANYNSDDVSVLIGYGNGSFEYQRGYATGSHPTSVAVSDFNDDSRLDLVVVNSKSNYVSVLLGYGNASFAGPVWYLTGTTPQSVGVGDFNNDRRLDIVITNSFSNDVSVLFGYGNGSFADQVRYLTGSYPYSVAVGDFNNNTRLDIVVTNYDSYNVIILLQYYGGFFKNGMTYASGVGSELRYVAVTDMNNDDRLDIMVANYGTNSLGILFGHGNGTFLNQVIMSTGSQSHPSYLTFGYFNDDSQLDVAVAYNGTNNVDIWLRNGNELFVQQTSDILRFVSAPLAIVSGDLNNDGRFEICSHIR
ncbi:unnamed protein product [Rotaria socialis]|uniref:Uncharacterized protein n=2 Tax=Rotaria socialis TaxID=392032 RepID=A0A820Q8W2_9BILA|nr:unnamed protein product [Rotaria socialis]